MKKMLSILIIITSVSLFSSFKNDFFNAIAWHTVDDGLFAGEYELPVKSSHGDSKLTILKIDPKKYSFHMLTSSELKTGSKKAPEWAKEQNMIAVFNAGMFQISGNYDKCTGYLKNYKHINNPVYNSSYNNAVAFNPSDKSDLLFRIIDIRCERWDSLKSRYNSIAQGIRMIGCEGNNTWQQQAKKWSVITVATDVDDNVLILFCRSPYTMHQFVEMVVKSQLKVKRMMYLEGGPEASLYLNHNNVSIEKNGSYETGFNENDNNHSFWGIPNVIGIRKKVG